MPGEEGQGGGLVRPLPQHQCGPGRAGEGAGQVGDGSGVVVGACGGGPPGDDGQLDAGAVAAVQQVMDDVEGVEVAQPPADGQHQWPTGLRRNAGGGEGGGVDAVRHQVHALGWHQLTEECLLVRVEGDDLLGPRGQAPPRLSRQQPRKLSGRVSTGVDQADFPPFPSPSPDSSEKPLTSNNNSNSSNNVVVERSAEGVMILRLPAETAARRQSGRPKPPQEKPKNG